MFVPGIWILVGFIAVGHNAVVGVVFGGFSLAVAGILAWMAWSNAYEVVVDADEVRWRGFLATGRAPLRDLRRVKREWAPGRPVEFEFTRLRGFNIIPAYGLAEFIDRLQAVAPHVQVHFPAGARWYARWRRGVFEETN